jgi:hypothetical protein
MLGRYPKLLTIIPSVPFGTKTGVGSYSHSSIKAQSFFKRTLSIIDTMARKMRIVKRGKDVDTPSIWVNWVKCQHDGCEVWCRPGRGMQLHITRTHDGVSSVTFKDLPSSSSKDVRDSLPNQNIESISHGDEGLGTTFADDTQYRRPMIRIGNILSIEIELFTCY